MNDREKKVYQDLANTGSKIQLIIIDFLDDVTDIAVLEDGGILTVSEPFLEADKKDIKIDHIVSWESDEYREMWKKSCRNFTALLERKKLVDTMISPMFWKSRRRIPLLQKWKNTLSAI